MRKRLIFLNLVLALLLALLGGNFISSHGDVPQDSVIKKSRRKKQEEHKSEFTGYGQKVDIGRIIVADLFNPERVGEGGAAVVGGKAPFVLVGTMLIGNERWAIVKKRSATQKAMSFGSSYMRSRYASKNKGKQPKRETSILLKVNDKFQKRYLVKEIEATQVVFLDPSGSKLVVPVERGEAQLPSGANLATAKTAKAKAAAKRSVSSRM